MVCRTAWLAVALAVVPLVSAGQSLGDVAKKEQERREKLRKAGVSTRTVTETELASTKGTLANDPNATAATEGASTEASADPTKPGAPEEEPAASPEEYWRGRVAHARARVANAQRRHDYMQAVIRLGQPVMQDENGRRVIYSNQQLKAKADAAQAELAAAQAALESLMDEARRRGAQPGWLR